MQLYFREKYLKKMRGFYHDVEVIKVITGVRRSGKSCLMAMVKEELLRGGVAPENIIFLDLDSKECRKIKGVPQNQDGGRAGGSHRFAARPRDKVFVHRRNSKRKRV